MILLVGTLVAFAFELCAIILFLTFFVVPVFNTFLDHITDIRENGAWKSLASIAIYVLFACAVMPPMTKGMEVIFHAMRDFDFIKMDMYKASPPCLFCPLIHVFSATINLQLLGAAYPRLASNQRSVSRLLNVYYFGKNVPFSLKVGYIDHKIRSHASREARSG